MLLIPLPARELFSASVCCRPARCPGLARNAHAAVAAAVFGESARVASAKAQLDKCKILRISSTAIGWFHFITLYMYMNQLCKNPLSQEKKWIYPSFMLEKNGVLERETWKGNAAAASELVKTVRLAVVGR